MSETTSKRASAFGDVPDALRRLLRAEMDLGRNLLESALGTSLPSFNPNLGDLSRRMMARSCCDIPPPCWMPHRLGHWTSHVSSCSNTDLTLVFENCAAARRGIRAKAMGDAAVTVTPSELVLPAFGRGTITVTASIPKGVPTGTTHDVTVVIVGCRVHYLRWTLSVGTFGLGGDLRVCVDDCPDQIHHWYDHFYCPRPCRGRAGEPVTVPVDIDKPPRRGDKPLRRGDG